MQNKIISQNEEFTELFLKKCGYKKVTINDNSDISIIKPGTFCREVELKEFDIVNKKVKYIEHLNAYKKFLQDRFTFDEDVERILKDSKSDMYKNPHGQMLDFVINKDDKLLCVEINDVSTHYDATKNYEKFIKQQFADFVKEYSLKQKGVKVIVIDTDCRSDKEQKHLKEELEKIIG